MIAHKRKILGSLGGETPTHRTAEIDALADSGPTSIEGVCKTLDPERGTAIITEGLINYFDEPTLLGMWKRFATALHKFPSSLYLSDLILREGNTGPFIAGFSWLLSAFVRGKTHMHFDSVDEAERALTVSGMPGVLLDPREFAESLPDLETEGAARVRIIEAQAGV